MTTTILSAACPELPGLEALAVELRAALRKRGEIDVRWFDLAAMKLAYCQGEFDCWVKTPGICRSHDGEQEILRAVHDSDQLVLLDVVTFGGHSYSLKRAEDRLIPLVMPFFERRAQLTHHGARYARSARLFALGWMPEHDEQQTAIWRALADANAINLLAPRVGATVVDDAHREAWPAAIAAMLGSTEVPGAAIQTRRSLRELLLAAARPADGARPARPPRNAALIIGSAKVKGTSASEAMARALAARLDGAGVASELHFAVEFLHEGKGQASARAVAASDLVMLVTPLYVDALPALAVRALDRVAGLRGPDAPPARFAMLVNCGFPEPEQNRTALAIARQFCAQAGYHWAGGLPLGGGGVVDPARPLDDQHGPVEHIKRALDAATPALARGDDIPPEALRLMVKAPFPEALYRIAGDLGWRVQAHRNRLAQRALWNRPLDGAARTRGPS